MGLRQGRRVEGGERGSGVCANVHMYLHIGSHVSPQRRGRLGVGLTTVLDSDQAKVTFVVAAGVQLAVLTEQEANTGSADLQIGGSQVREAVSYRRRHTR